MDTAITFYHSVTGKLLGWVSSDHEPTMNENKKLGLWVAGQYEEDTHYVDVSTGTVQERPEMLTTLNGLVLSDVPPNSEITIENETYPCPDGGDVTLNFQHPGKYIVKVSCFPYLDKEFEIDYQPQE